MESNTCPKCGGTGKLIKSDELHRRRMTKGMSLVDCAHDMGISPSYLVDLEKGRRPWNAELFARFQKAIK